MILLLPEQAADIIGVATATLASWRHQKRGPTYLRFGRVVRYRETAIEEWILSQEVHPIEPAEAAPEPEDLDDKGEPDLEEDAA